MTATTPVAVDRDATVSPTAATSDSKGSNGSSPLICSPACKDELLRVRSIQKDDGGDNPFMQAAIESALAGVNKGEGGPFGCAIVRHGEILAVEHNTVLLCHDPTNHAEMNCIRTAAKKLDTPDLSDCDLYTTCEPCPMCWGATNWARIRRVFIGADRKTAAKFGFDDEFFYQELDLPQNQRSVRQISGILASPITEMYQQTSTYRRRLLSAGGLLQKVYARMFSDKVEAELAECSTSPRTLESLDEHMQAAVDVALEGASKGQSKEREPFGAVVVHTQQGIVARCHNTVMRDRDPTATAEVNAIREACKFLKTHVLDECDLYTTTEPDPMSLGALYWSRIKSLHVGVSAQLAASFGFEDGLLHYKELMSDRDSRAVTIVDGCMSEGCEKVFEHWKSLAGKLY